MSEKTPTDHYLCTFETETAEHTVSDWYVVEATSIVDAAAVWAKLEMTNCSLVGVRKLDDDLEQYMMLMELRQNPEFHKIVCDFDGCGDEGTVELARAFADDDSEIDVPGPLAERFHEFAEELLGNQYGSWGDGEGSCGEVTLRRDGRGDVNFGIKEVEVTFERTAF